MFAIKKIGTYGFAVIALTLPLSLSLAVAEEAGIWPSPKTTLTPFETESRVQTEPPAFWLDETKTTISDADVPSIFNDLEDLQSEMTPADDRYKDGLQAQAKEPGVWLAPKDELGELISALDKASPAPLPEEVVTFQKKILMHPSLTRAAQGVCQAKYQVLQNQSGYYPNVSMSLGGGRKIIDETTRADEYGGTNSPEYDGAGLNATLTLTQRIFDWGRLSSIVDGSKQGFHVARLERRLTMEDKLRQFFEAAFDYRLQDALTVHFAMAQGEVAKGVETMRERFKAGAARLTDVRQAQIIGLEVEARLSQAQRQRDLHMENMDTLFGVSPDEADVILDYFSSQRPAMPNVVPSHATLQTRLIRHNIDRAKAEYNRLQAERKPTFNGVLTGRGWDIGQKNRCNSPVHYGHPDSEGGRFVEGGGGQVYRTQNCSTHELVGSIEFSMPLFDGGANAAQRGGVNAERIGLEATLAAFSRDHDAETQRLHDSLRAQMIRISESEQRFEQLTERLESVRILQSQTRFDPLALMVLEQTHLEAQAQLLALRIQTEGTHMQALAIGASLSKIMQISLGEIGC